MKQFVSTERIHSFFELLNKEGIKYVIRNNVNNELPYKLESNKDIDLLIHEDDRSKFETLMNKAEFDRIYMMDGRSFVGSIRGNVMWVSEIPEKLYVHSFYKLCCKSFNNEWTALSDKIQQRIWSFRLWNEKNEWWELDDSMKLFYLVIRCVFDKGEFDERYIKDIRKLLKKDRATIKELLFEVFKGYTDRIIFLLDNNMFGEIYDDYRMSCTDGFFNDTKVKDRLMKRICMKNNEELTRLYYDIALVLNCTEKKREKQ